MTNNEYKKVIKTKAIFDEFTSTISVNRKNFKNFRIIEHFQKISNYGKLFNYEKFSNYRNIKITEIIENF